MGSEIITTANQLAFGATVGSRFPHMSVKDSAVWTAFLATRFVKIDRVMYDVALGGKAAKKVVNGQELVPMWKTLVSKRVDAVVWSGGEVWTCEVKPVASMSALGQALTYQFLWNAEKRTQQKARACVVCARIDDDVEEVLSSYNVLTFAVSLVDSELGASVEKVLGPLPAASR